MFPRVFSLTTQSLERGVLCRMAEYAAKTPIEVAIFLKENGVSGDICDVFEGTVAIAIRSFVIGTLATTRMASLFPLELLAIVCDPQLSQYSFNVELAIRNLTTLVCDILSLCLNLQLHLVSKRAYLSPSYLYRTFFYRE